MKKENTPATKADIKHLDRRLDKVLENLAGLKAATKYNRDSIDTVIILLANRDGQIKKEISNGGSRGSKFTRG